MDNDAPVQPTTGDAKPPIERLHTDALGLVFAALVEMPVLCNQRIVMEAPLRLSHVCRRWRSLALASPKLWSRIIWSHRGSVEVAFTLLERSRSALLDVLISLPDRKEPGGWSEYASEADWEAARRDTEKVFRALLQHFWRTSSLDIRFYPGTPSSSLLAPLLSTDTPCTMPNLRRLYITAMGGPVASIPPHLNIACPPLVSVSLDYLLPRSWSVLLGPTTLVLRLDLKHRPIQIGELWNVLRLAPNLRFLALPSLSLVQNERPAPCPNDGNGVLCTQLEDFDMYSFSSDSIALLSTLPIHVGQNTTVKIHTYRGTPFDLAYKYLHAEELVGITSLSITHELSFATATGTERIVSAETIPVGRLRNLFVNTPVLSTVTVLTADFEHWPELVHVLASAPAPGPASLPRLETLRLSVPYNPDPLDEEDPADAPDVPRVAVLMSALVRIELALRFTKLPPQPLVQRVACALAYLRAPGAVLLVDDVYRSLGDADFARCCDMLREEMRNESVPGILLDFSLHRRGQPVSSCNACS